MVVKYLSTCSDVGTDRSSPFRNLVLSALSRHGSVGQCRVPCGSCGMYRPGWNSSGPDSIVAVARNGKPKGHAGGFDGVYRE
jgi:hypothetical protein